MRGLRSPKEGTELRPPEHRSAACLNCGAPLTGPFCASCGQRGIPPYPSAHELVDDALWEVAGWDGRFAASVRALLIEPGRLTLEWLEGRRVRYMSPLRLYLAASVLYFLLAAIARPAPSAPGTIDVGGLKMGVTTSRPQHVAEKARGALASGQALSPAERDSVLRDLAKAPWIVRPFARRAVEDPAGMRKDAVEGMSRTLFILLPVFAAIVGVFYRHKKFPEHLYFAVHLHAFVFVALALTAVARMTHWQPLIGVVGAAVAIWIAVYATMAFRRVYGGGIGRTLAKEVGIGALYLIASIVALFTMVFVISLRS